MGTKERQAPLVAGTVIDGRYRITRSIGRGGFAWVYEGEHVDLGRAAAIKVLDLPAEKNAAEFTERFLREARIIARLSHPNVVSVYDFGVVPGSAQPYIAMELLAGHDLERELEMNGPLEPARAKRLFIGALHALRIAHRAGVVHKDLKPSNLYIASAGQPDERLVLLDFGIAWAVDDDARMTQAGGFTGTPAYVAPEYARHLQISPAIDVYQIGLILSEALSCVPCVEGNGSVSLILAHCQGDIQIPDQVRASDFGPIIETATSLDPSARYVNGEAFAAALEHVDPSTMPRMTGLGGSRPITAQNVYNRTEDRATLPDAPPPTLVGTPQPVPRPPPTTQMNPLPSAEPAAPRSDDDIGLATVWYIAGIVGLVVIAAATFKGLQTWSASDRGAVAPTPALVETTPVPDPPEPTIAEVVDAGEPGEEPQELALQPRFVINSQPMGAAVFIGDEPLGRTPVVLRGDRVDGSATTLRMELEGYHSSTVEAELLDGGRVDLLLQSARPEPTHPALDFQPDFIKEMEEEPWYKDAVRRRGLTE